MEALRREVEEYRQQASANDGSELISAEEMARRLAAAEMEMGLEKGKIIESLERRVVQLEDALTLARDEADSLGATLREQREGEEIHARCLRRENDLISEVL